MNRLLLLALLALPGPLGAQRVVIGTAPTGWIGFRYEIVPMTPDQEPDEPAYVIITEVVDGSPADRAGFHVGDTITAIDGEVASNDQMAALSQRLRPGVEVRFALRRRGRTRDVAVEAVPRPDYVISRGEVGIRLDSVRGIISAQIDSLRGRWVLEDQEGIMGLLRFDPDGELVTELRGPEGVLAELGRLRLRSGEVDFMIQNDFEGVLGLSEISPPLQFFDYQFVIPDPDEAFPFELYLVHSEQTDSLRTAVRQVRESLARAQRAHQERYETLARRLRAEERAVRIEEDEELQRLQEQEETLRQQLQETQDRLSAVSREAMQRQWQQADVAFAEIRERQARMAEDQMLRAEERARGAFGRAREADSLRWERVAPPLTHFYVGQSFIAGAQVEPLNPDLGEYFGVREGVLVMEVAEGTPAEEAGLVAGDVIVSVGERRIRAPDDLRRAISVRERPLTLTVVRRQERIRIRIRE